MEEIYDFHESREPGNFYRNHLDLLLATIGGRVNRYILMPYVGVQAYHEGLSQHKGTMITIGSLEALCLILFVTYFGPVKKSELMRLVSPKDFHKVFLKLSAGYAKGTVLRYPYFYKLAKIFPEHCPKSYFFMVKTSFLVQNALRTIL